MKIITFILAILALINVAESRRKGFLKRAAWGALKGGLMGGPAGALIGAVRGGLGVRRYRKY